MTFTRGRRAEADADDVEMGRPQQARAFTVRLRQRTEPSRLSSRLFSRAAVDGLLDRLRLLVDTFPHGLYQPVPGLSARSALRADGCVSRWEAMRGVLDRVNVRSAVDVGSNGGFFSLSLGAAGIPTLAVDQHPANARTASLAARKAGLSNVGVTTLTLASDTVELLGPVDCIVFLSVWHHLVMWGGLDHATTLLNQLWARTRVVMFFDTGENEMPDWFGLPAMTPDSRSWLTTYLSRLPGARVEHLGRHDAFDADGNPCKRHLFAILREPALEPALA